MTHSRYFQRTVTRSYKQLQWILEASIPNLSHVARTYATHFSNWAMGIHFLLLCYFESYMKTCDLVEFVRLPEERGGGKERFYEERKKSSEGKWRTEKCLRMIVLWREQDIPRRNLKRVVAYCSCLSTQRQPVSRKDRITRLELCSGRGDGILGLGVDGSCLGHFGPEMSSSRGVSQLPLAHPPLQMGTYYLHGSVNQPSPAWDY